MAKLIRSEQISLKNHPSINETAIQEFIFNDPSVLGLGELIPIQREKIQPSGGRLDLLLSDPNGEERYEVEIQLGPTDPSHIIRTIEYWDTERKRYPKYDHCAVIVAEEITGRFMNVISLFNGSIPLIALQLSAIKRGEDVELIFTKVLDRITLGDEDEEVGEATDRAYWEKRSSPAVLKLVDKIFADLSDIASGYELKYNKFYIGLTKDGTTKNFITFRPKKTFLRFQFYGPETEETTAKLDDSNLDANYMSRWKAYDIRFNNYEQFKSNRDLVRNLVTNAKSRVEKLSEE